MAGKVVQLKAMSSTATRWLVIAVIAAVVVTGAVLYFAPSPTKTVTAEFDSAVGLYPGSDVKVLGIKVGTISKVKPQGTTVKVWMKYEKKIKIPSNAVAVVVAPSLVSDRFIQFAPAYTKGAVLANKANIDPTRTAVPVELDDIYAALNKLNVALGPEGSNKNGALTDLINTGAANLDGNGEALGNSIDALSKAAKTLADGKEDLFGTVKNLQVFTQALASSDAQVRRFNEQFALIAQQLANERQSLGMALKNLAQALNDVAAFVKKNKTSLHTTITSLEDVTGVLVKQKGALEEILAVAPTALSNLGHAYNDYGSKPAGTLDVRANFSDLADPAYICGLLDVLKKLNGKDQSSKVCTQLATQLGCLVNPVLKGTPLDGLLLPVCAAGATPGLPGLPKIPGLPL